MTLSKVYIVGIIKSIYCLWWIGDDLFVRALFGKWIWKRVFKLWKTHFSVSGTVEETEKPEKRRCLVLWGTRHLESHIHTIQRTPRTYSSGGKYTCFALQHITTQTHSQKYLLLTNLFWYDGVEMHLPSSWTHESVNTKHKLSSDSCSSSDIELRECKTTKS